jgi:hypothetical protein
MAGAIALSPTGGDIWAYSNGELYHYTTGTVAKAPAIVSPASTTFTLGTAGSFTVSTTGSPTATVTESGALPSGVSFVRNGDGTGTLSGVPAAGSVGTYDLTVTATNGTAPDASQTFTLTVAQPTSATSNALQLVAQEVTNANAVQMAYSPSYNLLFLRNSGSAVYVVNALTGAIVSTELANSRFSDMSLTADGKYLYVADYGGTNIGYASPSGTSYVDRYDVAAGTWTVLAAPAIAYHIAAVDDNDFLLMQEDQFTAITLNTWNGTSITQTASTGGDYESDFAYDPTTQRVIFGNSGSSSQEILADRIVNGQFNAQESSGVYGSAQGYGGTDVLSTDDSSFYYGRLQVNALDVTQNKNVFLEQIVAANATIAFGADTFYNAQTAAILGTYGFTAQAIALSPTGSDIWMFANGTLFHYTATVGQPPGFSSANTTTFTRGAASSFTVTTTGSPDAAILESGALPSGISFVSNGDGTATLSGTPAAGTSGTYVLSLTATNGLLPNAVQKFTLVVV